MAASQRPETPSDMRFSAINLDAVSKTNGPDDFTLHLDQYMNGEKQWQRPRLDIFDEDFSLGEPDAESTPPSRRSSDAKQPLQDAPVPFSPARNVSENPANEETFARLSALHAEVEKMREEEEARLARQQDLERENAKFRSENEQAQRRIAELEHLQQKSDSRGHTRRSSDTSLKIEVVKANERIKDLTQQLREEQIKGDGLEAELDAFKEDSLSEIARLEDEVREESNKSLAIAQEAAQLAEEKERHEQSIRRLEDEAHETNGIIQSLRRDGGSISAELDQSREQLQDTRRILGEVEKDHDQLAENYKSQNEKLRLVRMELHDKCEDLEAAHKTIEELRETQDYGPQEDTGAHAIELHNLSKNHEETIASLKTQHAKATDTLRSLVQKTVQSRKRAEEETMKAHTEQFTTLQQRVTSLEQQLHMQQEPSTHSAEDELRSAIRVLSNKLTKANTATKAARAEAEESRQYAASIEEANNDVNAELEARLLEKMEAREQEWHRRAQLLFKERDRMSKALLHSWGREEVGTKKGEKQAYRYKYAKGRS
ncbi:uncharacterized protein KY384_005216 [Bacidia gigantensis]|uniref:uncharacterized protein n=1 Tax=Bacidia gigantensis TaxID=2732470 RepID=UPI001D05AB25|nr:uncharacterized protein KY384_005216 [Bacidia gigantensis]KAG8529735.1 hypothetical protein KY384_005216 [Bacidia gigantensis]